MFDNINDANRYATKYSKRLEAFGFSAIRTKIFEINEVLSAILISSNIIFYYQLLTNNASLLPEI